MQNTLPIKKRMTHVRKPKTILMQQFHDQNERRRFHLHRSAQTGADDQVPIGRQVGVKGKEGWYLLATVNALDQSSPQNYLVQENANGKNVYWVSAMHVIWLADRATYSSTNGMLMHDASFVKEEDEFGDDTVSLTPSLQLYDSTLKGALGESLEEEKNADDERPHTPEIYLEPNPKVQNGEKIIPIGHQVAFKIVKPPRRLPSWHLAIVKEYISHAQKYYLHESIKRGGAYLVPAENVIWLDQAYNSIEDVLISPLFI